MEGLWAIMPTPLPGSGQSWPLPGRVRPQRRILSLHEKGETVNVSQTVGG